VLLLAWLDVMSWTATKATDIGGAPGLKDRFSFTCSSGQAPPGSTCQVFTSGISAGTSLIPAVVGAEG